MKNRTIVYLTKNKARKILENPLQVDLKTFLSATFTLSSNNIVKKHIGSTLQQLGARTYRLSA